MELVVFVGVVLILDVLAHFFGHDSRGITDNPELFRGLR